MWKRVAQETLEQRKVPVSKLRVMTPPEVFPCETTAEIEPLKEGIIGQDRAVRAMDFGLKVRKHGYNLFVAGSPGTGKTTYAKVKARQAAEGKPVPDDWCYVYNFTRPDHPLALSFPAGEGMKFKARMEELIQDIEREVRKTFAGDEYEKQRRQVLQNFEKRAQEQWKRLDELAREFNFSLERTSEGGIITVPLMFGKPLSNEEFNRLSEVTRQEIKEKSKKLEQEVAESVRQIQLIEKEVERQIAQLNKDSVRQAVQHLFQPLFAQYEDEKVREYLRAYQEDVIDNHHFFKDEPSEMGAMARLLQRNEEANLLRYKVNVLVDNSGTSGAPVIFESNPTHYNLFGRIEYRSTFGTMTTDFTMIKPGSLHMANGGYLIVQVGELLRNPLAWHVLKRVLKTEKLRIETPAEEYGLIATSGLKPEAIPLDVKVILIGSPYVYYLLSELDEDFHKLFKVKVEFDTDMKKDGRKYREFAASVRNYCEKEGLLPFHRSALAELMDYSTRLAGDQRKLTARFHDVNRLLVEASFWAEEEGSPVVEARHVRQALAEQEYRANRLDEKMRELIEEGTIMVDVDGEKVGQINGLAVMQTGDYTFGQPHRITARTFIGRQGIINIERETSLSGQLHHKGLLILSGYLAGKFAQNKPLPLSASITFEQTYSMVDGDSASSTELYALLSSLSGIPIKQGIAVTGSVNQWGEIQPIGGVNEKIEGFFAVCKAIGLTGKQGVIIPHQNVKNLMLRPEVIEAVESGQFHIWQVRTIEEGIEILTGVEAGTCDEKGDYEEGTVFGEVNKRLTRMFASIKDDTDQILGADAKAMQQRVDTEAEKKEK
ncbi:ATP-binding protein [Aneurinibacillus thermoaerophilus]|uniref:Lon protease family protein n=1 Tax=Aneurinibacillus thermoaerophilus TaxID=143495 RepID=UPI002E2016B7|nr:ATP-binding protein [Aneurinibacillus thermoaerophilus]MED0764258.1 ATP-binding protein [Aneurinibacillus thermoaerophilus]